MEAFSDIKFLVILCGIPFSGKTYLARKLKNDIGATRVDLDEIKFEMFGDEINDFKIDQSGWGKIYQEMYTRIENNLKLNRPVIHDTGNFTVYERGSVEKIAARQNASFVTVFVNTPIEIAKRRLIENRESGKRFDISDDELKLAANEMEPPVEEENPIIYNHDSAYSELLNSLQEHFLK